MKKLFALLLCAAMLCAMVGCQNDQTTQNPTDAPFDTSPLSGTTAPGAATTAPKTTAKPSAGATTAGPSASAGVTATPSASAGTTASPAPSGSMATANPIGDDFEVQGSFATMVDSSAYVLICKVTKDNGIVDILEGTLTKKLAPQAYIGEHQFTVEIVEVLKGSSAKSVKKGDSITYSIPYNFSMDTNNQPYTMEDRYVALTVGKTYVLFATYDEYGFFNPEGFEPNKFLLDGETMTILTGKDGLEDAWQAGKGKTGIAISNLRGAID